jgi:hypothetical protein
MPIVGGFDIHRNQITFDYLDVETGQLQRGQIVPADRAHLAGWLAERFAGRGDVAFAVEGCTGWRYVVEELARAGVVAHVAEPAQDARHEGELRLALDNVLKLGAQPDDRTGALVALLNALNVVPKVVTDAADKAALKRRAKEISESEWAAEAVRQAVQAMQAAMTAAIVSGATAGAAASGS